MSFGARAPGQQDRKGVSAELLVNSLATAIVSPGADARNGGWCI